jgi:hypothetical protein
MLELQDPASSSTLETQGPATAPRGEETRRTRQVCRAPVFGSALEACRSYESVIDEDEDCQVSSTIALSAGEGDGRLFLMRRDWSDSRSVMLVVSEVAGEFRLLGELGWNSFSEQSTSIESIEHRFVEAAGAAQAAVLFEIVMTEEDASTEEIVVERVTSFVLCGTLDAIPLCSEPSPAPEIDLERAVQCPDITARSTVESGALETSALGPHE